MNISAKVLEISETQQVSDSFRKREFVVEYAENPQYPEYIKFETIQSNCDQLDQVKIGENVNIQFNLKGRRWTDPQGNVKYFNSLQAWRIESVGGGAINTPSPAETSGSSDDLAGMSFSEDDDLPF